MYLRVAYAVLPLAAVAHAVDHEIHFVVAEFGIEAARRFVDLPCPHRSTAQRVADGFAEHRVGAALAHLRRREGLVRLPHHRVEAPARGGRGAGLEACALLAQVGLDRFEVGEQGGVHVAAEAHVREQVAAHLADERGIVEQHAVFEVAVEAGARRFAEVTGAAASSAT